MKKLGVSILMVGVLLYAQAQDPEFSQYYAAPLYINPAFAGTTMEHRFIANYRNQWPAIARGFQTYAFSYDYNLHHYNSGVGFLATVDQAGTAGMRSSSFNFIYSYKLNLSNRWIISPAVSFGYASRNINYNQLLFGDQLQFDQDGSIPSDDPAFFNLGSVNYFDFNTGMLAYNSKFWFGFAVQHLNKPNRSLVNQESTVPVKTTVHGGVRLPLKSYVLKGERMASIMPSFFYKRQDKFDQLDLGVYLLYEPLVVGVWYRGIPIQQNVKDNISQDAIVAILGFQFDQFEIAYSYDFTVSELGPVSGGTHELSLRYKMPIHLSDRAKKPMKYIPCPTFNHRERKL